MCRRRLQVAGTMFGAFRHTHPVSRSFGYDRGQPIDRYYIDAFLGKHASDISGRTLEIADNSYTVRFGGTRVTRSDILHAVPGNPAATIVADLTKDDPIPESTFNCIILTQTLNFIYDLNVVLRKLHRMLAPGGVLLATVAGISQISRYDMDRWGDYWRFTDASARRLFEDVFGPDHVEVATFGNVLTACAFLHGLAAHELSRSDLDFCDIDYQLTIGVRGVRPFES